MEGFGYFVWYKCGWSRDNEWYRFYLLGCVKRPPSWVGKVFIYSGH